MTQLGYYSPGIAGATVGVLYAAFGQGTDSAVERLARGAMIAPALFVACQLLMFAAQGISVRVLPVPFGKSLRGTKCRVVGLLIITGLASGLVFRLLRDAGGGSVATVIGAVSLGCWLAAIGAYVWAAPTAVADFTRQDDG